MEKKRYSIFLIFFFIVLCTVTVYGISAVLSFLNTGAERASILHLAVKSSQVYLPKTTWLSFDNPGREMEEQTAQEITKDYLNSWHIKNVAYKDNSTFGIQDYYTDSAQVNLIKSIGYNAEKKLKLLTTTLSHHLKLNFYSADGQFVVFTDNNVEKYTRVVKDKDVVTEVNELNSYKVMMLLEDGFWRIRHLVQSPSIPQKKSKILRPYATTKNDSILINGKKFTIRGINYYPQESAWDMFGKKFDSLTIHNDFKLISNAGLNTIRIFVQYKDFGEADVLKEKLEKLKTTLQLAKQNNLKVIVTLFDFYGDYSVSNWTLTHRHAEQIVSAFKNNTSIIAWDIKNEPDLDFKNRGKKNVLAWLEYMIKEIKKYDKNHLITIGWSNSVAAKHLHKQVDYVSFHHFNENLKNDFADLKKEIPNKPLVLEEFGVPSYRSIWNAFSGYSKKSQATYHQQIQSFLNEQNVSRLSWTLYDFKKIPSSVAGSLPWKKNKQKHFGFIDSNGNKKPSFDFINSNE